MEFAKESRKAGSGFMGSFRRDTVDFASIAGGKYQSLFQDSACSKLAGGPPRLVGGKGNTLADLDRSGAVIQSNENDFHAFRYSYLKPYLRAITHVLIDCLLR